MYQVCSRFQASGRTFVSPCPSRLLLSVGALILKEYENLHVHFEDCVGRRVTDASWAFLELAPSSGSSSDAFHINIQKNLTVMFSSCTSSLRLECFYTVFCSTDWIKIHINQTLGIMCYLHPSPHHPNNFCIRKPATGGLPGRRRSPLYLVLTYFDLAHLGGHARHILPPFSPSRPVFADEEIICWGTLLKFFDFLLFATFFFFSLFRFLAIWVLLYAFFVFVSKTRFSCFSLFLYPRLVTSDERGQE